MSPLPNFGAPATPSMGGGNGGDPSQAPGPGGAPAGAGGEPDQDDQDGTPQGAMSAIRDLGQMAQQIGTTYPALQPEAQQMQALIRRMIIKAGQAAPTQTPSAAALPG